MATIQERVNASGDKSYRVQVRLRGAPPETATFSRITDARKWAQQTEADIRAGRHFRGVEAKRHTVAEMLERYEEQILPKKGSWAEGQAFHLQWWKERLGPYMLAYVTPAMIAEKRDELEATPVKQGKTEKPRSASTVIRYMATLSHVFTVAVREWGWLDDNPVRKVTKPSEPRGRVRFLSDTERERLLAASRKSKNPCLYDVVLLALSTGMRRGEIMNLTWDAVDFQRRMITLEHTKNGERRAVPLVGPVYNAMWERSRIRRIDSPYVFPARLRYGKEPQPIDIQNAWLVALKRADIKNFRFHDLRHSAASYLAMNGASLPEIAAVLGHKTLAMVQRYAHLSDAHTSKVVERMNQAIFSGESKQQEQGSSQ